MTQVSMISWLLSHGSLHILKLLIIFRFLSVRILSKTLHLLLLLKDIVLQLDVLSMELSIIYCSSLMRLGSLVLSWYHFFFHFT